MRDYSDARQRMVATQIVRRGVRDGHVLEAMRLVPRECFVEAGQEEWAYSDGPLPIGQGQTISQPYVVAWMIEAAQTRPGAKVLEVGAGSGYAAAVLSRIAAQVFAIERHASLARQAQSRFDQLGYDNITLRAGDGSLGWPEAAPFDAILVSAAAPTIPPALTAQLAVGGRLVAPVGEMSFGQTLRRITRVSDTEFEDEALGAVAFVPLVSGEAP